MAMQQYKTFNSGGFAVLEGILVIVAVVGVIAVGGYVLRHRASVASSTVSSTTPAPVTPAGTSASIGALTQQDAQTEATTDTSSDSQAQQTSTSSDSAVSNVGGAYNESDF